MIPQHPNVPAHINDLLVEASTPNANGTQGRNAHLYDNHKFRFGHDYYGKYISDFKTNAHDVSGSVFAASEDTFYLTDFTYDGEGPDAYFWAGTSDRPSPEGFIVPDEYGTTQVLKKYFSHNIAITLPDSKKISDIKWLSVWCRKFAVNFGHVMIPSGFDAPKPVNLGPFKSFSHGVKSGDVVIKDARTIAISNLYYDGNVSDTHFLIGRDLKPHPDGNIVPNENGKLKLQAYHGESIEIRLPNDQLIMGMRWLSISSTSLKEDFGHVSIPENLNVPADLQEFKALVRNEVKFDNCLEVFPGVMQVSWKVLGEEIYFQLAGHADVNEYLAFGLSADKDHAVMVGADVAVAFFDSEANRARVVDYYLSTKSQCADGYGACPDTKLRGDDNIEVLSWNRADGILTVTYKRPIEASDDQDLSYITPMSTTSVKSVVAAIGPLNSQKEVAFHDRYYNKEAIFVRFKVSPPSNDCGPLLPATTMKVEAWPSMKISDVTTFRAQIGPTGGDKGYTAITGLQSWGIAWWINGLLIPELTVQRGTNYTFIVEGGNDISNSASYHPLYITNNPEGGGGQFLDQLGLPNHVVYAGLTTDTNQQLVPTGAGRLCEWKHKSVDKAEESETFEDYKKTLQLECKDGKPGTFIWMPDEDTPDVVY
ncbi:Protein Skeletor, isoforms D/E, partial [Stegodyphus mimosarum]